MKTNKIFLTFLVALFTTVAFSQIASSEHDFSAWAVNGGGEASLCDACHTPHQSIAIVGAPLWNHTLSTVTTYTNYTSPTFDATDGTDPSGTSLLCLSCHDGTTALDSYGGATGSTYIVAGAKIGNATSPGGLTNDLSTEHPISFTYASSVTGGDTGLVLESTVVAAGLLTGLGGTVECASCHDVHNQGLGTYALLKVSNINSALCTTCHVK